MSADAWAPCPKCQHVSRQQAEEERKVYEDAYGKVPEEQYLELRAEVKKIEEERLAAGEEGNFRENYEIGLIDGKFMVNYRGFCTVCGFKIVYKVDDGKVVHNERS